VSTVIANLEARFTAQTINFEREVKRLQQINKRASDKIIADAKRGAQGANAAFGKADLGGALRRSLGGGLAGLKADLAGLAAGLAATFSVGQVIAIADTYNRFTNGLRMAGLEGANLATVQDALFASATRNGVAVEGLGQLYSRLALSSRQLGTTQAQNLAFTEAVTQAVRVSGASTESARGAIIQLSQAMGGGIVRGEEYNSIIEGIPALAVAAANASETYRGNVAALRQDIIKGKVTSKEFFDLIMAGSRELQEKAAKAPLTVAQSMESLKTSMVKAIGTTNEAYGFTRRLTEALNWLAQNLDTVANALGIVAAALAMTLAPAVGRAVLGLGTYVASTVAARAATLASIPGVIGLTAGLTGMSRGAAAAALGLRLLTSATGVGLAITALTVAIGAFTLQSMKADEANRKVSESIRAGVEEMEAAKKAADASRVATGELTDAELEAAKMAAALTGQQDLLADSYWRVAAAAKAAALAQIDSKIAQYEANNANLEARRRTAERNTEFAFRNRMVPGMAPVYVREAENLGNINSEIDSNEAVGTYLYSQRDKVASQNLSDYAPTVPQTAGSRSGGSSAGGRTGISAEDRARNSAQAYDQSARQLRDAVRGLAETVEERHAANLEALADDRRTAVAAIDQRVASGEITAETGKQLRLMESTRGAILTTAENRRYEAELAAAQAVLSEERLRTEDDAAQIEIDALRFLAANADTLDERHAYERDALRKEQEIDDRVFEAEMANLALDLEKQGLKRQEIDDLIAARRLNRQRQKDAQTNELNVDQGNERGPSSIREWADEYARATAGGHTFNQQLYSIAQGGLDSITNGLTDAIMGAKSFGEAFADMAKGVISQLIRMGIQFLLFEGLGRMFGMPGLGRVAIGLPSPGKNAMGTDSWGGGLSWVGERGPELVNLPKGAGVIPTHEIRNAMRAPSLNGASAGSGAVQITTHVHANDAVLTSTVKSWITAANVDALQAAAKIQAKDQMRRSRQRFR